MSAQEFCYWLMGLFELADPKTLNKRQTALIKKHLELVFICVTRDENNEVVNEIDLSQIPGLGDYWPEIDRLGKTCTTGGTGLGDASIQVFC